jgi:hypothetical protein
MSVSLCAFFVRRFTRIRLADHQNVVDVYDCAAARGSAGRQLNALVAGDPG